MPRRAVRSVASQPRLARARAERDVARPLYTAGVWNTSGARTGSSSTDCAHRQWRRSATSSNRNAITLSAREMHVRSSNDPYDQYRIEQLFVQSLWRDAESARQWHRRQLVGCCPALKAASTWAALLGGGGASPRVAAVRLIPEQHQTPYRRDDSRWATARLKVDGSIHSTVTVGSERYAGRGPPAAWAAPPSAPLR